MEWLKGVAEIKDGSVSIKDKAGVRNKMDSLIYDAVFEADDEKRKARFLIVKEIAKACGAVPASIQGLYEELGKGYRGFTVPAMNIRGLTYDTAKAIFRKALKMNAGAMIFEIARSEIGYTKQRPLEYSTVVLAAAVKEGYEGPVFIQGDHFQFVRKNYLSDANAETTYVRGLISEAVEAEFYNIDIDASTLVDLSKGPLKEQQSPNYTVTADMTSHIRSLEPKGVTISIGGEIGEIGGKNSTVEEMSAFLSGFRETLDKKLIGISKISVQSGTTHGGVVLPDGTLAKVKIDFDTLTALSDAARKEYGLSGAVQHGASTLPEEAFVKFPETGTAEVHLATGFQNIIYDNPSMPSALKSEVYDYLHKECAKEKKEGQTEEQFIYSVRKKGFGPFKKKWWDMPAEAKKPIVVELEDKFGLLFDRLKVVNTMDIVKKTVKPVSVRKDLADSLKKLS
ncbi:MAG: class II fructose-bisphosphate aldolase [Nitrospirae bacterium]|nr:class II fructose-bisphosphate aldolase [Nitrospirota bacterium]